MTVGVLLAVQGPEEAELVSLVDAPGGELQVVRRCADVPEVLAAGLAGLGSLAVVSADLPGVDRAVVRQLATAGVRTVLLAEPADVPRCRALGAAAVVDVAAGPAAWVLAVQELARTEPATAEDPASPDPGEDDDDAPVTTGRLVAVWGPPGAPGRTSVAVSLAHELRTSGPVLLVDADTEAPSVAHVLGVLDETAGIASAARLAGDGRLDAAALAGLTTSLSDGGPRLLTGLTRADRWRELPAASLDVIWEQARAVAAWTVVDTGAGIEDAPAGFAAGIAPRRHQATISALSAADVVVVVGAGEPLGMHRLVVALQELADSQVCGAESRRVVVVNRVRGSAAGASPEQAIVESLARFAGVEDPLLVPDDRPAFDRAVLRGAVLAEVAASSRARVAIQELAERLAGPSGVGGRRGLRRLARPRAGRTS